jgi:hypothetical protein
VEQTPTHEAEIDELFDQISSLEDLAPTGAPMGMEISSQAQYPTIVLEPESA